MGRLESCATRRRWWGEILLDEQFCSAFGLQGGGSLSLTLLNAFSDEGDVGKSLRGTFTVVGTAPSELPIELECLVTDKVLRALQRATQLCTAEGEAVELTYASRVKTADGLTTVRLSIDSEDYSYGMELTELLQITPLLEQRVTTLSGGEKQRVAIARALMADPCLLLADEPTGNLNPVNCALILRLLAHENEKGRAIVLIAHDMALAAQAHESYTLSGGTLHPGSGC